MLSEILKAVQHPVRRTILFFLHEKQQATYSELLAFCELSTGKLNYHLRILRPLIEKKELYQLSSMGKKMVKILEELQQFAQLSSPSEQPSISATSSLPSPINRLNNREMQVSGLSIVPDKKLLLKYTVWTVGFLLTCLGLISMLPFLASSSALPDSNPVLNPLHYAPALVLFTFMAFLLLLWGTFSYFHSISYQLTDTEVITRKGILTRSEKLLPFRTITNLKISQGPLDRLLGIQTLEIFTAGSAATVDEKLPGLITSVELKEWILERVKLLNPPEMIATPTATSTQLSSSTQFTSKEKKRLHAIYLELRALNHWLKSK